MNLVFGILCLWIGAALMYVATDPSDVADAIQANPGHGTIYALYKSVWSKAAPHG